MNAILVSGPSREQLLHALYEAAELEHNLMCTYLYAAFSLRRGEAEGLSRQEAQAVLQHFIHLERPECSTESDGEGFASEFLYKREARAARLTPMGVDYDTVGKFYATLGDNLRAFVARVGESMAFCGDPALQLSPREVTLAGAKPVICLKTALTAFTAIVEQGEGAPADSAGSHFKSFISIRTEMTAAKLANPAFNPAFPAAVNPVQRTPMRRAGRVWIEDEAAAATVDLANSGYALMLRLIAYSYAVPGPSPEKALAVDLSLGLMRAVTYLGERAARLPAGPSNPHCNAGMSFIALRDAAPLPRGPSARRFLVERLQELADAAAALDAGDDPRLSSAARHFAELAARASREFAAVEEPERAPPAAAPASKFAAIPEPVTIGGVDDIEGKDLTLIYDGKKWQVRGNLEIISGTGRVVARVLQTRLCRCGGSNTKPFCDGTHASIGFKST